MAKSHSHMTRTLLGLILTSDLTEPELRGLARELRNGSIALELAEFLDALYSRIQRQASFNSISRSNLLEIEKALAAVRRPHLSKDELIAIIRQIDPKSAE